MIVVLVILAGVISFVVVVGIRPVLARLGAVDVPNERSSHSVETLRGAGVGPFAGLVVAVLGFLAMIPDPTARLGLLVVLGAVVASGTLGFVEDIRGVRIGTRATIELLIGIAASAILVSADGAPAWWLAVGAVIILGYINVANFMDGINGVSGMHAIVVGATYAVATTIFGLGWIALVSAVLAAAFAGFLPLNLAGGRVFLGDTGSYLLGATIGTIALCALIFGVPPLAVVGPVAIYLADTGFTLTRRILRGERWYAAHRTHVYQRLTDRGLSHIMVAVYVSAFSIATSALGLMSIAGLGWAWAALAGIVAVALLYLASPAFVRERGARKSTPAHAGTDLLPVNWMTEPVAVRHWAVVGATGFVGRNLVATLRSAGAEVIEVRGPRLRLWAASTVSDALAVLREGEIERVVEELATHLRDIDVVINAAGIAGPDSPESPELFGANALLPTVVAEASARASAYRYIHLSSAAVQGSARVIDETTNVTPFSPYSLSKALGEQVLAEWRKRDGRSIGVTVVRATSVQGEGRRTTARLQRLAASPFASVAAPGNQKTPVSSVGGLAAFVAFVGAFTGDVPAIVLQPWEGMTTRGVLEAASGRRPPTLPAWFCRVVVAIGYALARGAGGTLLGPIRRLELMWFGQSQAEGWADATRQTFPRFASQVLAREKCQ